MTNHQNSSDIYRDFESTLTAPWSDCGLQNPTTLKEKMIGGETQCFRFRKCGKKYM